MEDTNPGAENALDAVVDKAVVAQIGAVQRRTVGRLKDSKQQLQEFNRESSKQLPEMSRQLQAKIKVLNELCEDLLHTYQQLRVIKELLPHQKR